MMKDLFKIHFDVLLIKKQLKIVANLNETDLIVNVYDKIP